MNVSANTTIGIVGYDIYDVRLSEMRQMSELKTKIGDVLESHAPDSKDKKYISDDDLRLMFAILHVFTAEYEVNNISDFTAALATLFSPDGQLVTKEPTAVEEPVDDPE